LTAICPPPQKKRRKISKCGPDINKHLEAKMLKHESPRISEYETNRCDNLKNVKCRSLMQYDDDVTTNPRWWTDTIFDYFSAPCCPINAMLEEGSRITHRRRSHDQNNRFRKFNMADGCHFENC